MALRTLPTMADAFPEGLPPAPQGSPNWSSMDYDQFAMYYHTAEIGSFEIPIANVNIHTGQRPLEILWVKDLMVKFVAGIHPHANFGVALLNTPNIPRDTNGQPDGSQMHVSNICALHHCTACWNMEGPDDEKTWFFRVYKFGLSLCYYYYYNNIDWHNLYLDLHHAPAHLLGAWISSYNQNSDRLPQRFQRNLFMTLTFVDAAYNPQDANTNRKINSCLNTLEVETRGPIKALVHNPRIVRSLLKVHEIPVWHDMFMTKNNIGKVTSSKWSNEVHIHHCFNYNCHY